MHAQMTTLTCYCCGKSHPVFSDWWGDHYDAVRAGVTIRTLSPCNINGDFMSSGCTLQVQILSSERNKWSNHKTQKKERQGRWNGCRKWRRRRRRKWEKRKRVLSLPRENWSSLRLMCLIDLSLSSLFLPFFHVTPYSFLATLTHPHTHTQVHTPGCYYYWLPKLPLNFHLALRLVCVPAPLLLSPKPLEVLLAGRSMAHSPRAATEGLTVGVLALTSSSLWWFFCTS